MQRGQALLSPLDLREARVLLSWLPFIAPPFLPACLAASITLYSPPQTSNNSLKLIQVNIYDLVAHKVI